MEELKEMGTLTVGAGCFWCIEALFKEIKGVENVVSGYSGGETLAPNYREVSSGLTGHAEVVQFSYYLNAISLEELMEVFFTCHNPTLLHKDSIGFGTQYRSIILCHTNAQKDIAIKKMKELETSLNEEVTTQIVEYKNFYKAEAFHQNYYERNPNKPFCAAVIAPRLRWLRKMHADKLRLRMA